jgi:hypothetical protein
MVLTNDPTTGLPQSPVWGWWHVSCQHPQGRTSERPRVGRTRANGGGSGCPSAAVVMVDRDPRLICDGKHTSIDTRAGPVFAVPETPRSRTAADRHRSRVPLAAHAHARVGPGAFTAPLASVSVVSAVLLVGALGSSAVARQLAGMDAAVIGLPAPYGLLATASRTRSACAYAPKRLSAC